MTQLISIRHFLIGNYVQGNNNNNDDSYSHVYTFGHYDSKMTTEYLQIYTTTTTNNNSNQASPPPLKLSPLRMVLLRNQTFVPASNLQVGDELGGSGVTIIIISDICQVTRTGGAYAPFTKSGTIVVNGIVASSFVTKNNNASQNDTMYLSFHWLAYFLQAPHRLWCRLLLLMMDNHHHGERYAVPQEGISPWIPTSMMQWWTTSTTEEQQQQQPCWLLPLLFVVVVLCTIATVLEYVVQRNSSSPLLLLVVVAVALYARRRGKRV